MVLSRLVVPALVAIAGCGSGSGPADAGADDAGNDADAPPAPFRIALSVSPFSEIAFAVGQQMSDGTRTATSTATLENLFVAHGGNEVYARIATDRVAAASGIDASLARGLVRLGIARGFYGIERAFREPAPIPSRYASSDYFLGGRVVDARGRPLWYSRIEVAGQSDAVHTQQDGRFLVSAFEPGPHRVFVFPLGDGAEPSMADVRIEAVREPAFPLIRVPRASVVTCSLLDARNRRRGLAVQRFSIDTWCSSGRCSGSGGVFCGVLPRTDDGLPTELSFAWGISLASVELSFFGAAGFAETELGSSRDTCELRARLIGSGH